MSEVANAAKTVTEEQHEQTVNGLIYQLDAHKQTLNENLQISLNLRTNLAMFQKEFSKLQVKNAELETVIKGLNQQLTDATTRLTELEPKTSKLND